METPILRIPSQMWQAFRDSWAAIPIFFCRLETTLHYTSRKPLSRVCVPEQMSFALSTFLLLHCLKKTSFDHRDITKIESDMCFSSALCRTILNFLHQSFFFALAKFPFLALESFCVFLYSTLFFSFSFTFPFFLLTPETDGSSSSATSSLRRIRRLHNFSSGVVAEHDRRLNGEQIEEWDGSKKGGVRQPEERRIYRSVFDGVDKKVSEAPSSSFCTILMMSISVLFEKKQVLF